MTLFADRHDDLAIMGLGGRQELPLLARGQREIRFVFIIAKQPAPAPLMLRVVPHTVPRGSRSYEHFPDGFELHLLTFSRFAFVLSPHRSRLSCPFLPRFLSAFPILLLLPPGKG